MSWGISEKAQVKERIKAEVNDILIGMSSFGDIDYNTYSNLYDHFTSALDKMAELSTSLCDDIGFVIYDKNRNLYYYGSNSFGNQLRKAKVFHDLRWVKETIKDINISLKDKKSYIARKLGVKDISDLCFKEVGLKEFKTYNINDIDELISENKKLSKCQLNILEISKLQLGDIVRVKKTGKVGVVTKFNPYTKSRYNNYATVSVEFEEDNKKYKKTYSASSLEKVEV